MGGVRAIFCVTILTAAASAAVAAPNIDHYASLPGAESAAISPDGGIVAIIQGAGGDNRMIAFYPLDGSKPGRVDLGPMKTRDLTWVSNDRVIVWASVTSEYGNTKWTFEWWRAMSVSESTGAVTWLFSKESGFQYAIGAPSLVHPLPDDPDHVLMGYFGTIWEVDLASGKSRKVEEGNENTSYFVADARGEIRIRSDYVDGYDRREFYHRMPGERKFAKIAEFPEDDTEESKYSIAGFNAGGDGAYAIMRGEDGRWELREYSLSGDLGAVAWSHPTYDLDYALRDQHTRAVIGAGLLADHAEEVYFDADLAGMQKSLKNALKSYDAVSIESWSRDRNMLVVRASRAGAPSELYLFDRPKKELSFLASNYPNIPAEAVRAVEQYEFRSSDGLKIPGYLITPAGKAKANLPLVVLPHGGPWARDSAEFDWEAQYYAALGYAVYKPNFRGSTGYGIGFRDAGNREWGGKMQDDITEGVKKLIADGIADPARICIVGGSYGGYAALMGGAKTPDLYKCVVAYAPVTDIPALFRYDELYTGPASERVKLMRITIGDRRADPARLRAISPVNLADSFAAPVLLIHGRDDTVVPMDQSQDMHDKLRGAGKESELIVLDGEDHWLSTASTRKAMLEASGAFLVEHLGQ